MIPRVAELGRFVQSAMTCTGQLRRVTAMETHPTNGSSLPVYARTYAGPCLVYALDGSKVVDGGGGRLTITRYAVTLPTGTDVKIGDLFTATDSPLAPDLVGYQLRITDTPLDAWQVALTCTAEHFE